jgi:putative Mg2+ transporter-C (MgtC) family protein
MEFFNDVWEEISSWTEHGLPVTTIAGRLALATFLGLLVGLERERREHAAGMRTHAVVSVASALIMLVSAYGFPEEGTYRFDPMRLSAQVVSGIGFLGAGVIIFRRNVVHGLTTAASVWAVAGVGLAVGGGLPITASIGTAFLLLIQGGLRPVKQRLFQEQARQHRVVLAVSESKGVLKSIRKIATGNPGFELLSLNFDDSTEGSAGLVRLRLEVEDPDDILMIVQQLQDISGVSSISWQHGRKANGKDADEDEDNDNDSS